MARQFKVEYDEALREHMAKKGLTTIVVEVMSSQSSDFEFTELYPHLIPDKQVPYFKEKKHFWSVQGELGEVLLPPYRLEYDDTLRFSLKKFWIFHSLKQTGIRL
ncbi:MAG: hypothetical protein K6G17_09065 [Oscillospiraceae bacterium]|nr:hypothetical protein [Oscillospiraceae bacterium]